MKPPTKITAENIREGSRDPLMVRIIQGATKAGVQPDRRKEADRKACRGRVRED